MAGEDGVVKGIHPRWAFDMDRRHFFYGIAAAAGTEFLGVPLQASLKPQARKKPEKGRGRTPVSLEGCTLVSQFLVGETAWKVYEDLRVRDGNMIFVSPSGESRQLPRRSEAAMAEGTPYLGLALEDIGLSSSDLLADRLLNNGDPDPEMVRSAAPPMASSDKNPRSWTTFVGTKEAYDVTPVYRTGNTRTYHPIQYSSELREALKNGQLYDGLVGGWMPAVRKVIPISGSSYWEIILFGDVTPDKNKYIVHTWHRTARIENGKIAEAVFGHSYPAFPPARQDPTPDEFYRALLDFVDYWDQQLEDVRSADLPDSSWVDLPKHAFAKELMTRPGGIYPKYGAVDRDYAGSEYDGFQDVFTSAIYANMEWGRLETARLFIDNYFSEYVDDRGMIDMRGPETAQFGLTLSLVARYFNYSHDTQLMLKHRAKIESTAKLLGDMHDASLRLAEADPGYGLICGWSESDSCLGPNPSLYWQPYYANSAFASRGLKDLSHAWKELGKSVSQPRMTALAEPWFERSERLAKRTVEAVERNIQSEKTPPYIGLYPGTTLTFRESLEKERPSPQQWPHRPYCELLQADILPPRLANLVVDCMRAHGATTMGVVANVGRFHKNGREILGFISYGYAQMLLRLDRIEEFLLFLYAHRYHAHTRGSWTAGEVTGITGDGALYCVPAQHTIALLVRWMLVLEDSDEERLYLAQGVPRDWLGSGKPIGIERAPTRWGEVTLMLAADRQAKRLTGHIELDGQRTPREIHLKLRAPSEWQLSEVTVNGHPASLQGTHKDTLFIEVGHERRLDVSARII